MDIEDVSERLLEERVKLGYNQSAFARLLGVSRETLRLIEMGTSVFKVDILIAAAAAGVDVQYVVTGIKSINLKNVEERIGFNKKGEIAQNNFPNIGNIHGTNINIINNSKLDNLSNNHTEIKTNEKKIDVTFPGTLHISLAQREELKKLVNNVVSAEENFKEKPKTARAIWSALNRHCGVNTYTMIAFDDYEKAEKFLLTWLGRIASA